VGFPTRRMRRLRGSAPLREMVAETRLAPSDLVLPLFVRPGEGEARPIESMPGNFQYSIDRLVGAAKEAADAGVPAVLLFGIPSSKDSQGSEAYAERGIVQEAVRAVKSECPSLVVVTDVCLCEYTDHGHCGPLKEIRGRRVVDNDAALELLARAALTHAEAGADVVAPSDMMDGRVGAIRIVLDEAGHTDVPIMSYAAKYASAFYGPFRDAAESPPKFGDRRGYQMDYRAGRQAALEADADAAEGADMLMVKPALAYLDVIADVRRRSALPLAAYHVSGEYAMLKAAAANGWLDERGAVIEVTTAIKRAGADLIITYYAEQLAEWLGA